MLEVGFILEPLNSLPDDPYLLASANPPPYAGSKNACLLPPVTMVEEALAELCSFRGIQRLENPGRVESTMLGAWAGTSCT